ncbi:ATP-dependent dethiobiotin synthetase BioD [Thalassotalea insulae]|uniref:ATP-dependent dethiobiotin synthetase BioD n=1 Tax=Thalassotalea insulae TaxID=2056778 RepID=A0ABQ6GYE3_9GAMM|nr:dethiobiotin synthase [Thalassotalea insulae]GLX80344.1 ATP-dependent dethiobiotin synthetase BioD [Thalassotalea insulae]
MKKIFITATDTDAGKTHIAQSILYALSQQKLKVAAFKPISAGCELIDDQLINEDARLLAEQANCGQTIAAVNPIAFKEPIAPHIAAAKYQQKIELADIYHNFQDIVRLQPDVVITEGAGGWRLPLGQGHFLSEFAQQTEQQVILIVNMKLGCLNHAVLTYQAICQDGLSCLGWIANCQEEMPYLAENLAELTQLIKAPLIGKVLYQPDIKQVAQALDLTLL